MGSERKSSRIARHRRPMRWLAPSTAIAALLGRSIGPVIHMAVMTGRH